jgi:hypothetical protein
MLQFWGAGCVGGGFLGFKLMESEGSGLFLFWVVKGLGLLCFLACVLWLDVLIGFVVF